jgi:hypothetical protein
MNAKRFRSGQLAAALRSGLLLIVAAAAGCNQPATGHVSGQVRFNGKPLPGGYVNFMPADPKASIIAVTLDGQGRFSAVLPAGDVQVSIDNRELEPRQPIHISPNQLSLPPEVKSKLGSGGKAPEQPPAPSPNAGGANSGRYIKIPDRYYDAAASGLSFKVQSGDQTHDFDLKD